MRIYDTKIKTLGTFKAKLNNTPTSKEIFYKDIDLFLKNLISKEEYLKKFNSSVQLAKNNKSIMKNLSIDEKMYISDVRTSIDLAECLKDVSKTELTARMNELLKNKNSIK